MNKIEQALEHFKAISEADECFNSELAEYRREAVNALCSRIRHKPIKNECPACRQRLMIRHNFCPVCGQALDWRREA